MDHRFVPRSFKTNTGYIMMGIYIYSCFDGCLDCRKSLTPSNYQDGKTLFSIFMVETSLHLLLK
jgi:hypothetical protein